MSYVDLVGELLRTGASANAIDDHLREAVTERMELDPDLDAAPVGELLVAWYAHSTAPQPPAHSDGVDPPL
jgi:hypothetical protein